MMLIYSDIVGRYAGHQDLTPRRYRNITERLLPAVNHLLALAQEDGVALRVDPDTGTPVSGSAGASGGNGGFRPQDCPVGAPKSAHKDGEAVDVFDPDGAIAAWCARRAALLSQIGLYMEHPSKTPGWVHLQTRPTASGRVIFYP